MKMENFPRRALLSNLQFLKSGVEKSLRFRFFRSLYSRSACNPRQGNVFIHVPCIFWRKASSRLFTGSLLYGFGGCEAFRIIISFSSSP